MPGPVYRLVGHRGPAVAQPERLDGAGAGDGRGEFVGEHGASRALLQVRGPRPAQVPAGDDRDAGEPEQGDGAEQRVEQEDGDEYEQRLHGRDEHLGDGVAQGRGHRADVDGAPRGEVACRYPLDHGRGQGECPVEEAFADPGGRALAEAVADGERRAGQDDLDDRAQQDGQGEPVDDADRGGAGGDRVDDPAEQPRPGQPGDRREGVEEHHLRDRAPVVADQPGHGPAHVRAPGDRQLRHRRAASGRAASPAARVTSAR
nr:hypothetical protein GCM10020092_051430 [Actinoplanes digitatis]